jgi:hypothetical protein
MTPEQVAEATLAAIVRGKREVVLTGAGRLLVGLNRFVPGLLERMMARKVRSLYRDELQGPPNHREREEKQEPVGAAR